MDALAALGQAPEGLTAWGKLITAVGQGLKVGTVDTQQPKYPTKVKINQPITTCNSLWLLVGMPLSDHQVALVDGN